MEFSSIPHLGSIAFFTGSPVSISFPFSCVTDSLCSFSPPTFGQGVPLERSDMRLFYTEMHSVFFQFTRFCVLFELVFTLHVYDCFM